MIIANRLSSYIPQQANRNTASASPLKSFSDMFTKQTANSRFDTASFSSQPAASIDVTPPPSEKVTRFRLDESKYAAIAEIKPVADNYPATLTDEQIADIKSRYDFSSLEWPTHESAALGEELFELGVIDDDQRRFFYGCIHLDEDSFFVIITPAGETPTLESQYIPNPGDSLIDILLGELDVQQRNLDFLKSPNMSGEGFVISISGGEGAPNEILAEHIERNMRPYQSIYEVMRQFIIH